MKVLMYGWEFPPRISGGLGVACYAIVKELAKKNVELTLVLPHTLDIDNIDHVNFVNCSNLNATDQEFAGIVNIKYPQIVTYLYPYVNANHYKHLLSNENLQDFLLLLSKMQLPEEIKSMAGSIIAAQAIDLGMTDTYEVSLLTEVFRYASFAGSLAEGVEHDVIHAHDWLTILAALEAKHHSHKPLVFHVHALETDRSGFWVDKRIFAIEKYGMEQADRVIAVSQYTKNNIVQHYGIDPAKITVIHNGVYSNDEPNHLAEVARNKKHDMVLFLGRVTQQKGPYFFIEVAKKVLEKRPETQFVLAGNGDLLIDMIEQVANLRIGKNVHFTGFLDSQGVRNIYKLADVYVMPSVSEPFGLSALEALSYNVPAIISKQSGVAEVLRHVLVADFWDTEEMAAKILALLEYQALRHTFLVHTRDDLRAATWNKAAGKIIDVYKKVA